LNLEEKVVTYAGVGRRAVALILDTLSSLIVAVPLAAMGGGFRSTAISTPSGTSHTYSFSLTGIPLLVTVLIWMAYMTYMEGTTGASLGKRAMGIRVIKTDESPADLRSALIRNLLRIVDGLFLYLVGILLALNSPQRQRLGDRAAGTVVVPAKELARSYGFSSSSPWSAASEPPQVPPPPPFER
jgi:uncharacterized RDD family membrane protein YckC